MLLIVAAMAGLCVAIPAMAKRLSNRGVAVVWFADPIADETFKFAGEPVEILTIDPLAEKPDQPASLGISWRGEQHLYEIEPGLREDARLPGLLRHDDWLRVLVMAEGARSDADVNAGIEAGTIRPRLIIAMRRPAEGYDPGSWGSVRRREWRYRFVELLPASSSPERASVVFDHTYAELDRLGNPVAQRDPANQGEVWKYYAMQHVTPSTLFRSRNKPVEDAMQAMGWTWPAAGISIIGLVVGLVMFTVSGPSRAG